MFPELALVYCEDASVEACTHPIGLVRDMALCDRYQRQARDSFNGREGWLEQVQYMVQFLASMRCQKSAENAKTTDLDQLHV